MTCTALQTELNELRSQRRRQVEIMENLQGPGLQAAQAQLDRIDADIASTETELEQCLAAQNPVPQNISGKVEKIECHTARREVGHDEPYLLIATFDMLNVVNAGVVGFTLPAINVVKIGPWTGVGTGETHYPYALNPPDFWDLNGQPRPIAQSQDVIFLVALMENDGSSPDTIRGAVSSNLRASRVTNTNRPYDGYVTAMISNMVAAIETSRIVGLDPLHLNEDDIIGDVKPLALATHELAQLNQLEPVAKTLRFTQRRGDDKAVNDYTVTFSFTV